MFEANFAYGVGKALLFIAFLGTPFWIPAEVVPRHGWLIGIVLYLMWGFFTLCWLLIWFEQATRSYGKHRKEQS